MGPTGGWVHYLQAVVVVIAADLEHVMVADGGGSIPEVLELGHICDFGDQLFMPGCNPEHCFQRAVVDASQY